MCSIEEIKSRSASKREMVVDYLDAIRLLDIYERSGVKILGWEGWVRHPGGRLGHSKKYQGTVDLSAMPNSSAVALAKSTIIQAHEEWGSVPEVDGAILLFCITVNK